MDFLKNKKFQYGGGGLLLLLILWFTFGGDSGETTALYATARSGPFNVQVTTSGELEAKNSTLIRGPQGSRNFRIYNLTIQDIVPEGTVLQRGDYVAQLDQSDLNNSLQDQQTELEEAEAEYELAVLDSSLTLSNARNNLLELEYSLEEAQIAVEQSQYESPATQRQVQIEYERAQRALEQARTSYQTEVLQARANLREIEADLQDARNEMAQIQQIMQEFTIYAPENGMVIYRRNRDGSKITEGSQVNAFDPIVAELPDFSVMNSITYINEVDIQKVRRGQRVDVGLDAMPEKRLTGVVTSVANIGEQSPNSDSKVFEVIIEINQSDSTLRPAMTTSNTIHVNSLPMAVYAPLETVHTVDSTNFVYKREGLNTVMQQVVLGLMNENNVVFQEGVEEGDVLFLSSPSDTSGIQRRYLSSETLEQYEDQELPEPEGMEPDSAATRQNGMPAFGTGGNGARPGGFEGGQGGSQGFRGAPQQ